MCGIFFSLSSGPSPPTPETQSLLEKRGPDSNQTHTVHKRLEAPDGQSFSYYLTFISTVLSLRGDHVFSQPLVDQTTQSVLCWNGEAWKIDGKHVSGNDTEHILNLFLQAVSGNDDDQRLTTHKLGEAVARISGPFAFVFYDATHSRLFFSRDCLGRRSLLQGYEDENLKICSICDGSSSAHFEEVGFSGVYMIDLLAPRNLSQSVKDRFKIETLPWSSDPSPQNGHIVCLMLWVPGTSTCGPANG